MFPAVAGAVETQICVCANLAAVTIQSLLAAVP